MSNFVEVSIGEIGKTITGKTPSSNDPEDFGDQYMFVTPSDNLDDKILRGTNRYISESGLERFKNKILPPKSVMVSCIGSAMGKVVMNSCICLTNQQINSIIINKKYDPDYIYYSLKNNSKLIRNAATGSTAVPILNKTDFDLLKISVHKDKSTQQSISKILSDLDAKIELNNQINQELEAMAKMLYDYWFVQFDFPNEEGKPYKSSGGKMVYNEELKREMPEGWEVDTLGEIEHNIVTGKTPPTKETKNFNGDIPFICIGDVRGNMHITKTEVTLSKMGAETQANKYIPKGSICVTCIATPGLVAFATEKSQTNQQLNSIVCEAFEHQYYLYFYLKDYFKYAKAKTGNTFANMNKGDFSSIKVIKPTMDVLSKFALKIKPSIESILLKSQESIHLTELRDWLLPMLMNGQVKMKEAKVVEEEVREELGVVAEGREEY